MTVAELLKELKRYDQSLEVVTGELGKPELVEVLDRLVLRESKRKPAKPQPELAAV